MFEPPFYKTASLTPLRVCLSPSPHLPHRIPQAPPCPHCNSTQSHSLRAPVFRLPQLLLHTATSPQIVRFPVSPCSPCTRIYLPSFNCFQASRSLCPPVHELSPQFLLFPGSPMFLRYTNWPPWVRQFPEPPCSLTRQFCLPRFSCFQAPLICPVHGSLSQVLLFPGSPISLVHGSASSLC